MSSKRSPYDLAGFSNNNNKIKAFERYGQYVESTSSLPQQDKKRKENQHKKVKVFPTLHTGNHSHHVTTLLLVLRKNQANGKNTTSSSRNHPGG